MRATPRLFCLKWVLKFQGLVMQKLHVKSWVASFRSCLQIKQARDRSLALVSRVSGIREFISIQASYPTPSPWPQHKMFKPTTAALCWPQTMPEQSVGDH